jgi:hypothetical protein
MAVSSSATASVSSLSVWQHRPDRVIPTTHIGYVELANVGIMHRTSGEILAENLKRAHALLESDKEKGDRRGGFLCERMWPFIVRPLALAAGLQGPAFAAQDW